MKEEVVLQRIAKVREQMRKNEVDALVLQKHENVRSLDVRYLSGGFTGSTAVMVVTLDRAALLVDGRYIMQAEQQVRGMDVVEISMRGGVKEAILPVLGNVRRIGIIPKENLWDFPFQIEELVPDSMKVVPLLPIVEDLRALKDKSEIEKIEQSIRATEHAFRCAFEFIESGVSELEVQEVFMSALPLGAKPAWEPDPLIFLSGERTLLVHGPATDRIIQRGDVFQIDAGCILPGEEGGYVSDLSRVIVCGTATSEQKRRYNALVEAVDASLERYLPGENFLDAHNRANEVLTSRGYPELPHTLGHGIGLNSHEAPKVRSGREESSVFEVGNVASCEPGIYQDPYGMRLEVDVEITPNGPRILDESPWREIWETDKIKL